MVRLRASLSPDSSSARPGRTRRRFPLTAQASSGVFERRAVVSGSGRSFPRVVVAIANGTIAVILPLAIAETAREGRFVRS